MARQDMANGAAPSTILQHAYALRDELQRSVVKLRESNRELQAAIDEGDSDPVLRAAIGVRQL